MEKDITTSKLYKIINESKVNLIDVREAYEYHNGHVNGSTNIPTNEIATNYSKYMNKEEQYYIICASGGRSAFVCQHLGSKGYKVINVQGGMSSWFYDIVR